MPPTEPRILALARFYKDGKRKTDCPLSGASIRMTSQAIGRALVGIATAALLLMTAGWAAIWQIRTGTRQASAERLWAGDAPGAVDSTESDVPAIAVFLPPQSLSRGVGIVICPGGAYGALMSSYEGTDIAHWLNSFGVTAFVLRYRVGPRYHYPAPFLDASRAVRYIRYHAAHYQIRGDRVGIMGFSAGGHLASTVITHFDAGNSASTDPVDRVSNRPDFAILGYPVITMEGPWAHPGSVRNLLGPKPDRGLIEDLSNERHVTGRTPPVFLFHTREDAEVPYQNSEVFFAALRSRGVPSEMHLFEHGRHGAGLANGHGLAPRLPEVLPWSLLAERWLDSLYPSKLNWSYSVLFRI